VLALQSAALSEDALLLCDNEAVLRVIKKWVGQGYRHQRKEGRLQRAGVSKMKGSGARCALKIWISEEWRDLRRVLGARTFFSEKG
jgi:hypothetical protein